MYSILSCVIVCGMLSLLLHTRHCYFTPTLTPRCVRAFTHTCTHTSTHTSYSQLAQKNQAHLVQEAELCEQLQHDTLGLIQLKYVRMHTYIYIAYIKRTHTCTHTNIYTHIYTPVYIYTHIYIHIYIQTHIYTPGAHTHTYIAYNSLPHSDNYIHTLAHVHAHIRCA